MFFQETVSLFTPLREATVQTTVSGPSRPDYNLLVLGLLKQLQHHNGQNTILQVRLKSLAVDLGWKGKCVIKLSN